MDFKAFGSKLTEDGKFLFMCDIHRNKVIAIDTTSGEVVMTMNDILQPNDIAIWETRIDADVEDLRSARSVTSTIDKDIILFICGGWSGFGGKPEAHTGIYSVKVWGSGSGWLSEEGAHGRPCAGTEGCSFHKMNRSARIATATALTCAGIGLDF